MAHIGHPLLGDSVYGAGFKTKANRLGEAAQAALAALNRQALHAQTLGFEHPVTFQSVHLERPPPLDFLNLASALRV
jgi:23S rRNA pseudouridine1911/1915/1917 synthase